MKKKHSIELVPPLKVSAFALFIGWNPESVRRAIRAGRLKAVKVGSSWRIPQEEAEKSLSEGIPV